MPDPIEINETRLFEALLPAVKIVTTTETSTSKLETTRFVTRRKITVIPLEFRFGRTETLALDARLRELGFNFDWELTTRGMIVFILIEFVHHRRDGSLDYRYLPTQEAQCQIKQD